MKGILQEKIGEGTSAGRVIAIGFAIVFAFRLFSMTVMGMALGWPDAWFGVACVFAVPLHRLFSGARGHELARELLRGFGRGGVGENATPETVRAVAAALQRRDPELGIEETR